MARGEYCAKHGRYFGNVLPCPQCKNEFYTESMESLAIADGWADPCGRAMKPLMESTLQDLVASGPPDAEYQRLLRIEQAARELLQTADDIHDRYCDSVSDTLPFPCKCKVPEAIESLRLALGSLDGGKA